LVYFIIIILLYLTLTPTQALILILKHATLQQQHSNQPYILALTQAEKEYQHAKMDLKIQQHLAESSQDQPLKIYVNFIMATNIGLLTFAFVVDITSDKFFSVTTTTVLCTRSTCSKHITVFKTDDTCSKQIFSTQTFLEAGILEEALPH